MPFYPLVWQRILCLRFWNNLWMPQKKIHVVMNTNLEKQWKSGDKNKGLNFQITWSGLWNCWQPEDGLKTLREKTHVLRPWPTTCRWSLNTPRLLIFQNHIYCMCICKYTHIATMIRQSVPPNHKTQVPDLTKSWKMSLWGFCSCNLCGIFLQFFGKWNNYQHSNTNEYTKLVRYCGKNEKLGTR